MSNGLKANNLKEKTVSLALDQGLIHARNITNMSQHNDHDPSHSNDSNHGDLELITKDDTRVKKPRMYQVILLNDDYTPMDFVVWILKTIFHKTHATAHELMLQVHTKGRGICGIFPYDVARTKMLQVRDLAKKHEHPLECIIEALDDDS